MVFSFVNTAGTQMSWYCYLSQLIRYSTKFILQQLIKLIPQFYLSQYIKLAYKTQYQGFRILQKNYTLLVLPTKTVYTLSSNSIQKIIPIVQSTILMQYHTMIKNIDKNVVHRNGIPDINFNRYPV